MRRIVFAVSTAAALAGSMSLMARADDDPENAKAVKAGGFVHLPSGMRHFALANGETIIRSHSIGLSGITYVDPAGDPRLKKSTTQ